MLALTLLNTYYNFTKHSQETGQLHSMRTIASAGTGQEW